MPTIDVDGWMMMTLRDIGGVRVSVPVGTGSVPWYWGQHADHGKDAGGNV